MGPQVEKSWKFQVVGEGTFKWTILGGGGQTGKKKASVGKRLDIFLDPHILSPGLLSAFYTDRFYMFNTHAYLDSGECHLELVNDYSMLIISQ